MSGLLPSVVIPARSELSSCGNRWIAEPPVTNIRHEIEVLVYGPTVQPRRSFFK
jgi:hypothetical protein